MPDFMQVISRNILTIGITIVALFLLFQFYILPKFFGKKDGVKKDLLKPEPPKILIADTKLVEAPKLDETPDTTGQRMKRGFGVMASKLKAGYEKVRDSDYVKAIQEENNNPNPESFLPEELINSKDSKDEENPFATDLGKLTKVDF